MLNSFRHPCLALMLLNEGSWDKFRTTAVRPRPSPAICPSVTCAPGLAFNSATVPSNGAVSACSIFIASSVSKRCPLATFSPRETSTAVTFPGIGASISPSCRPCVVPVPRGSSSSNSKDWPIMQNDDDCAPRSPKRRGATSPFIASARRLPSRQADTPAAEPSSAESPPVHGRAGVLLVGGSPRA